MRAGTAYIRGPSTKEEKQLLDLIQNRKVDFELELKDPAALRGDPDCPQAIMLDEIEHIRKILAIVETANRRWGGAS